MLDFDAEDEAQQQQAAGINMASAATQPPASISANAANGVAPGLGGGLPAPAPGPGRAKQTSGRRLASGGNGGPGGALPGAGPVATSPAKVASRKQPVLAPTQPPAAVEALSHEMDALRRRIEELTRQQQHPVAAAGSSLRGTTPPPAIPAPPAAGRQQAGAAPLVRPSAAAASSQQRTGNLGGAPPPAAATAAAAQAKAAAAGVQAIQFRPGVAGSVAAARPPSRSAAARSPVGTPPRPQHQPQGNAAASPSKLAPQPRAAAKQVAVGAAGAEEQRDEAPPAKRPRVVAPTGVKRAPGPALATGRRVQEQQRAGDGDGAAGDQAIAPEAEQAALTFLASLAHQYGGSALLPPALPAVDVPEPVPIAPVPDATSAAAVAVAGPRKATPLPQELQPVAAQGARVSSGSGGGGVLGACEPACHAGASASLQGRWCAPGPRVDRLDPDHPCMDAPVRCMPLRA